MSINRLQIRHLAETKPVRARLVEGMLKNPRRLIGAILLGNNLVNVAMAAFATDLALSIWGETGIAYVTIVLTLAILIFAEITPKIYAKYSSERVSFFAAPVLNVIMILCSPVIASVTYVAEKILALISVDVAKIKRPLITEAELKTYINIGGDEGAITAEETEMLSRIFTLNDKTLREVMIPKDRMATIDMDASIEEIVRTIVKTGYSRFPVRKTKQSDIVGFIHAKDYFKLLDARKPISLKRILRPPYFVPADRKIDAQLRSFQTKKLHQAVVLDSEGEVAGLITLEDILEELVGSIRDEHDLA
jgi:putative hemolysin